jgi:hypothetical protein
MVFSFVTNLNHEYQKGGALASAIVVRSEELGVRS